MKKILGISLVALFAVTPMMAGAADLAEKTPAATDAQKVAAVSYVKGAYNAVASAVNTKQDQLKVGEADVSSAVSSAVRADGEADNATLVTEKAVRDAIKAADNTAAAAVSGLDSRLDVLEGDAQQEGSVRNLISAEATARDDAISTAQAAAESYADSVASAAQSAAESYARDGSHLTAGTVAKTALATDVQASLEKADAAATASALTAETTARETADSAFNTRIGNLESAGYITKDVNDLTNYTTTTEMNSAIATAKSEAISSAASDATTKASAAESAAKAYADAKFLTLTTTWTDETATSTVQLSNPTQSAGSEVQEG